MARSNLSSGGIGLHASTHENSGGDEISVAGLVGIVGSGVLIAGNEYSSIGSGTFVWSFSAGSMFQQGWGTSTSADGQNITYKVDLPKGTYTIVIIFVKNTTFGILDFTLGGVEFVSIDTYNGSATFDNRSETTGIDVASGGIKDLVITVDGKNGSSSAFKQNIQAIMIYRTA